MYRRDFLRFGLAGAGLMALSRSISALEYYPVLSGKKWAVIYSTWCGSSRDAAIWISEGMGGIANVFDVRENPKLSDFDYIVLGGSIRAGVTSQELQDYIEDNKAALKEKVRGLFAVCGNNKQPVSTKQTTDFIDNHLAKLCGVSNKKSRVFLGRITKSLMDAQTLSSMSGVEDYDNLKRNDCIAFGKDILDSSTLAKRTSTESLQKFELYQNYPNPFNPVTTIRYKLHEANHISLTVCTVSGRKLHTLVSGYHEAGSYEVTWDGSKLAPGYYLYKLDAGTFTETRTAKLVR